MIRARGIAVLVAFGGAVVLVALAVLLADPGIQTVDAEELARRRADAVRFFTLDFLLVVVYAVAGPVVLWRFGRALGAASGRVPSWLAVAVVALVAGGAFDFVENVLLLSASSSGSESVVRLAHVLAVPKYAFGVAGLILSLRAVGLAVAALRGGAR